MAQVAAGNNVGPRSGKQKRQPTGYCFMSFDTCMAARRGNGHFEGARALCEAVDDKILGENQFAYFFERAVLAKAYVGLGEPQRARKQFDDVRRRMDEDGIPLDFTIFTPLYHCLAEYCLQIGDIEQARRWADQLRDYAAPAPDNNHLAMAYGLLARIAFGAGDRDEAAAHLSRALSIVENADFPLAAWRVYDEPSPRILNSTIACTIRC